MSICPEEKTTDFCKNTTLYRSHHCGELNLQQENQEVLLAGWIHRKRDHGSLLFIDLRDHYGMTQLVISEDTDIFHHIEKLPVESVVQIKGTVVARSPQTRNPKRTTGDIEVVVHHMELLSASQPLPMTVNNNDPYPEETRLKYRFLDLRRENVHDLMVFRSKVISYIRDRMTRSGFLEIQTPILTATSPEGARDYVVPSRLYPGEFYALPQAPQQFKQLLMTSGFDRYFQVAPCFRDESSRADRSPGEFYQLDLEMAFAGQEDVFRAIEPVLYDIFHTFAPQGFTISTTPFPRISYHDSMAFYGCDKPDLRNPLVIEDFGSHLALDIFQDTLKTGGLLRGICVSSSEEGFFTRRFFKDMADWALDHEAKGLGYIQWSPEDKELKGPLVKMCSPQMVDFLQKYFQQHHEKKSDKNYVLFLLCDGHDFVVKTLGQFRTHLGETLNLIDKKAFAFCWIVDFPMYEKDEETNTIVFSHNPFSMPQGGLEALENQDPLTIKAYQYDIVCNGVELSSGAVRNHRPDIMYKAFAIAGYSKDHVEKQFGALLHAFQYGAPPHAGCAPGIDRMIMLLAGTSNIREIIPFPLTQNARDLLMGAPSTLSLDRWKELHLCPLNKKL